MVCIVGNMPYFRLLCLFLVLFSPLGFSEVKVTSYDINSAIKASSAGKAVHKSNVIATSQNNNLNVLGFWFVNSGLSHDTGFLKCIGIFTRSGTSRTPWVLCIYRHPSALFRVCLYLIAEPFQLPNLEKCQQFLCVCVCVQS